MSEKRRLGRRFGRSRERSAATASGWVDSRYTVDVGTASAALSELADLAGGSGMDPAYTSRQGVPATRQLEAYAPVPEPEPEPEPEPQPEPRLAAEPAPPVDRLVIVPPTPTRSYDPGARGGLKPPPPENRPKALPPRQHGAHSRLLRPRTRSEPAEEPAAEETHEPVFEKVDARTAAWFSALLPSEDLGEDAHVIEVRDGAGKTLDERPSLEALANMLLDLAPKTETEDFKGLHIVLESDGRRMELNIE
jgi:hypothetical protein